MIWLVTDFWSYLGKGYELVAIEKTDIDGVRYVLSNGSTDIAVRKDLARRQIKLHQMKSYKTIAVTRDMNHTYY